MKGLAFLGDSLKQLKGFPGEVRRKVGYALRFAQGGIGVRKK
jgi:phage-related protein